MVGGKIWDLDEVVFRFLFCWGYIHHVLMKGSRVGMIFVEPRLEMSSSLEKSRMLTAAFDGYVEREFRPTHKY